MIVNASLPHFSTSAGEGKEQQYLRLWDAAWHGGGGFQPDHAWDSQPKVHW